MKTKITTVTATGQALRFLVIAQKAGSAAFRVLHVVNPVDTGKKAENGDPILSKKTITIGARAKFATVELAIAHQDKAVQAAIKDGWTLTTRTFGGAAKPDAFTLSSLPKPSAKPAPAKPVKP